VPPWFREERGGGGGYDVLHSMKEECDGATRDTDGNYDGPATARVFDFEGVRPYPADRTGGHEEDLL